MKNKPRKWALVAFLSALFVFAPIAGIEAVQNAIPMVAAEETVAEETAVQNGVAKVGDTEYATIDEAIANWTNGKTLTLLADVTLTDVIKLSSTEYHVLDLGTYTMTAAKGKDAIQYVINGRSSAGYALDIKADANNPGGITATGATIVKHTKPFLIGAPSKDRPITRFYGGVFNASYVVRQGGTFAAGYTGASAPYFYFYGGVYNGTISTNRSLNQFHGGTFNGDMYMSVDSSAYTLITGGTFAKLSNLMGSELNSDKFTIGSEKGAYDKEVYVDDNGNYVIAAAKPAEGIEAGVAKTPGTNDYLAYSKVATEGQLNYTDAVVALTNNNTTSAKVTIYADEVDLTGVNYKGTIAVPKGNTLTIITEAGVTPTWKLENADSVEYKDENGNALVKGENGAFVEKVAEVANYDELVAALAEGGKIQLTADIAVEKAVTVLDGTAIDLNGKTLNINVENSSYGNATIKNGNIVLGKDDVHVCDGYFLVNEGKALVVDGVKISSSQEGIKGYAVFHLKTGANLDLTNSKLNISDNEYSAGYIVYASEATATVDVVDTTVTGSKVNGIVYATTVIKNSIFTITNAIEHGINRSGVTITNSEVAISGGTGRGITAQHGPLVIDGSSKVTITDMGEATIELRNNQNLTIAETATVTLDAAVNNTTSGTITGTVILPPVEKLVEVATYDELVTALADGGKIKLTADITVDTKITAIDGTTIDLNSKTLYVNVENSYYNNVTIKNGNIVLGKDDVHVCDGYFLVNEGKTLVVDSVNVSSSQEGIKGYAVFHLKTGANLDLTNSELNIHDNEHAAGYIVYAGEATATVDVVDTTVTASKVNGIVYATTVIENSTFTITNATEHGINRSGVTITDSTVAISGGTGRGITAQHGPLVIDGSSKVTITDMGEATIELRNNQNLTIAETATVTLDAAVNNTTSGTITGTVILPPMGNNFNGYIGTDAIWGEVWGNARESFVIKVLDANGNVMGTTSLNNIDGILDGDVNVTWSLKLDAASNTDEYWTMEWTTAPTADNIPASVELWVDGVKVSGGNVVLSGPDDIQKIYAATADENGKILAFHTNVQEAIVAAQAGDTIILTADIDYGTDQLKIEKAITLDLGGNTLTTRNAYGGISVKNNPTIKNGTIVHASNTAAIKVWNAVAFEDLVIDVQGKGDANKTIGGIVLQSSTTTRVDSIKNVKIKGAALTNGIETYNCGDATENVIGSMENVTINANGTGMIISAPCGTATGCTISGGNNAIEIFVKGTYSASLDLVNCDVEGGIFAHDEFSDKPDIVNNGTLNFTADAATTGVDDVTLTLARAENVEGILKDIKDNAQATVNNTYYATLKEAVTAAQSGDTVILFAGEFAPINISNKNITIQGTVGADGELLTTIKGGNPAITAHGFNGTIKDLKIVDAWKVMYAEPAGNVTVDNIYVTGATYGLHLVAYTTGSTWTIQNSYMDLAWANSFGVSGGGDAAIVIKDNEFASTNPYYPDYGALLVNTFLPNVTVEGNVFGENAKINIDASITDTSKINISKNYHADGANNAFVEDSGVKTPILEYYADKDMEQLVKCCAQIGTNAYASLADAVEAAKAGEMITLIRDVALKDILVIDKAITLDGNGKTLTSTAGRAINVSGADGVTIKNLTIKASGERAINVIQNATNVTIENVTATAANYTVNLAASAANAVVTIKNSNLTGLNVVNVGAAGANVTVDGTVVNCNDQSDVEKYAALCLNKDAKETTIAATNVTFNVKGDSHKARNGAEGGVITIDGSTEDVAVVVAHIATNTDYYYDYLTLADAVEAAKAGETITLIRDVQLFEILTIDKAITIDTNDYTLRAKFVLAAADVTLTAPEGLEVTTIAGYNVVYEDGVYVVKRETKFQYVNLSVGVDLSVNFYVSGEAEIGTGVMNFSMLDLKGTEMTSSSEPTEVTINGQTMWKFTFKGVGPHLMGKQLTATLVVEGITTEYKYSIQEYAMKELSRTAEDLGYTAEQFRVYREFLVNLLNYGAESQKYMDLQDAELTIPESELVTADLTEEQKKLITNYHAVEPNAEPDVKPEGVIVGKVVILGSKNKIEILLQDATGAANNATKFEGWYVKVYGNGYRGTKFDIAQSTTKGMSGFYSVMLENILVTEYDNNYDFFIYNAAGEEVGIISYSVQTYVFNMQNTTKDSAALTRALWNYYHAAEDYIDEF